MYSVDQINYFKSKNKKYILIDIIISLIYLIIFITSLIIVDYTNVLIFILINCILGLAVCWYIIYTISVYINVYKSLLKHFNQIINKEGITHKAKIINVKKNITISKNIICDIIEVEEDGIIYMYNILCMFNATFNIDDVVLINTVNNFITSYEVVYE